jgi:hypothetical protein
MKNLIYALLILSLVSCLPSDETPYPSGPTSKQYQKWLVKNPWIVTQYYLNGQPDTAYVVFPPCGLDNILYFNEDGTFYELEGPDKCGVSDTADYGTYAVTDSTFYLNSQVIINQSFDIIYFYPKKFKVNGSNPSFPVGADFKVYKEDYDNFRNFFTGR